MYTGMAEILKVAVVLLFVFVALSYSEGQKVLFHEDFDDTDNWRPLYFSKIKEHSSYTTHIDDEEVKCLKAESNASASALIHKGEFNIYQFPYAKWCWKVENLYEQGDAKSKEGDDYPIRIYFIFKYDPEEASFGERLKYKAAKALYGEYPPYSALSYIWTSKEHEEKVLINKYDDRSRMIPLQQGPANVGEWQDEVVNILEDYKAAFGKDPPEIASIAIMNDSDNTKESSTSYVDYIEIYSKQ
ncbi:DUF3047 domain-containing protein [Candidatus Poribacteria bacterium]